MSNNVDNSSNALPLDAALMDAPDIRKIVREEIAEALNNAAAIPGFEQAVVKAVRSAQQKRPRVLSDD